MNEMIQPKWIDIFAIRINRIRKERNLTIKQLAALTGFGRNSIQGYCSGRNVPSAFVIAKLAAALDCSTDELISITYDDFELAGFSSDEIDILRKLRDKYHLKEKDLIDAVKVMGPGLTKYKRLDTLLSTCSKKVR